MGFALWALGFSNSTALAHPKPKALLVISAVHLFGCGAAALCLCGEKPGSSLYAEHLPDEFPAAAVVFDG